MYTNNKILLFILLSFFAFQNIKAQGVYDGKNTKVEKDISADFPFESKYLELGTEKIHYVESGEGENVFLLHSIPPSSYAWRNVIA